MLIHREREVCWKEEVKVLGGVFGWEWGVFIGWRKWFGRGGLFGLFFKCADAGGVPPAPGKAV
jgi:hypothetical protein